MSETRDKLDEAQYFLALMKEHQAEINPFRWCLSAFLTAARSVTYFMQNEYTHAPGFKEWYKGEQAKMKADKMMSMLNDKRTLTIHESQVRPHEGERVTLTVPTRAALAEVITVVHEDGTTEHRIMMPGQEVVSTQPVAPTRERIWFFDENRDQDVVSICEEHMSKLTALVNECDKRKFVQ